MASNNRSAYINQLLKQEHKNFLQAALRKVNQEEAEDTSYQEELQAWDSTLSDGLINDWFQATGYIYWVDLEPTKGVETRKLRPYVIIQSDLVNIQPRTLIVAPLLPQA